jgi:hypothetical protein
VIEACWSQCAFVSMWPNNALEQTRDGQSASMHDTGAYEARARANLERSLQRLGA